MGRFAAKNLRITMNAKNLPLKFVMLALAIASCVYVLVWGKSIKYGIDLRGGHSLIYEIRSNKNEVKQAQDSINQLEADIKAAAQDQAKVKELSDKLDRAKQELSRLKDGNENATDLPERIIAILKKRVDPVGLYSLEWRPLGRSRIEIRMPAARKDAQVSKNAYLDAEAALEARNLQPGSIRRVQNAVGDARETEIRNFAGADEALAGRLRELAALNDKINQDDEQLLSIANQMKSTSQPAPKLDELLARQKQFQDARDDASAVYSQKYESLLQGNVPIFNLKMILKLYVSTAEKDAINNKAEVNRRMNEYDAGIKTLTTKYANRKEDIEKAKKLYEQWAETRQMLDDPSDLKRMVAKAGVLEFRIAPQPGTGNGAMEPSVAEQYLKDLRENGPEGSRRRNDTYQWFPIHGDRESYGSLVTGRWAGQSYVLLCNSRGNQMLRGVGADAWSLKAAWPRTDDFGRPAVGFQFDGRGSRKFYELTGAHLKQPMAILLDDEVYSAPNIEAAISESGIISGKFTLDEVKALVSTLEAGSLPARLNPDPVSENTFGPAMGEENLRLAKHAGVVSLIAIGIFMAIYYMLGGMIANFAMVLNLLLVMGAMSMFNAVFTLPGIAGLILSIGMAVDSNVLIYERLREEQAKGQSIRMALKVAYERAFRVILDSHVTSILTSMILFWIGTEEVKGFAVTLGLGVLFNLFTSVVVTKWIFQALLESNLVKRPLKMLHFLGVPKIQWMHKRYYFWAFSLITGVLGLAALVWQGNNIWGIEFSSGTHATIRFKDDSLLKDSITGEMKLPNDKLVRELLLKTTEEISANAEEGPKAELLRFRDTVMVEKVIDSNRAANFLAEYFPAKTFPDAEKNGVTKEDWVKAGLNVQVFEMLGKQKAGILTKSDLDKNLPSDAYGVSTTLTNVPLLRKISAEAFGRALVNRSRCEYELVKGVKDEKALGIDIAKDGLTKITHKAVTSAQRSIRDELADFENGLMLVVQNVKPAVSATDLLQRVKEMRNQPDFAAQGSSETKVIALKEVPGQDAATSFALLIKPGEGASAGDKGWSAFADGESKLLKAAMDREESIEVVNFDPAIAGETAQRAIMALVMGWLAIIVYLWLRFGQAKWGLAAVICLIHDVIIIVGLVAISDWMVANMPGLSQTLMIGSFKIDLTMIAALLTIIGYSVNDTIVVFDRIRENRGKLHALSAHMIDGSVNQTLARTLLTSVTVLAVVFIMYVGGGPGIHAFNYAMLAGVLFGTYSSIAVAAPILLGFKHMVLRKLDDDIIASS